MPPSLEAVLIIPFGKSSFSLYVGFWQSSSQPLLLLVGLPPRTDPSELLVWCGTWEPIWSNQNGSSFQSVVFNSLWPHCSTPGLPVHHQLLEHAQLHRVGDAIQTSHPLPPLSPPAFSLSQHQGLFQWVSSSHQVAKVLELQLQHQSLPWIFRADFL